MTGFTLSCVLSRQSFTARNRPPLRACASDGAWELFWTGVAPSRHGQGIGEALLQHVEAHGLKAGGTSLYIETTSLPALDRARGFYAGHGYTAVGRTPNHYGIGDDKLTFMKTLQ